MYNSFNEVKKMENGVLLQGFHWYIKPEEKLWKQLQEKVKSYKEMGFSAIWLPPAYKGVGGIHDNGYGVYDLYDLGEFNQKGSIETKYGTKEDYLACIQAFQKAGINVYGDIVLNHKMGADGTEIVNAKEVNRQNTNEIISGDEQIKVYTLFTFPGRNKKYSDFIWHWYHFDGTGFGITVGNALRRILLSSLEGFAITTIKIDGVEHEFSSVPGAKEDVTNIILNLKQVRFKQVVEEFESEKVSITVENSSEFKAGDIGKYLTGFEVLNPELVICHLDSKSTMQIDITINKGRGYVPADENREYCTDVNVIPIDSIYTPIRNVKYQVENFRVEQKTDYEKLVLEITTDGSIHPKEALKEAAKILIYHFMLFSDEKITLETNDVDGNEEFDEEVLHMRQLLKTKLVDMDLSVRALNCLKAADVETLGDLVQFNKTDLLKFRNFGKKSLTELDDLLESLNLSFGTDISKYKLDKE